MQYTKLQSASKWIAAAIFVVILITSFNSLLPHLVLAGALCLVTLARGSISAKINILYFVPLFLFTLALVNTLTSAIFNDSDITQLIFRTRKFFFEIIVAYVMLLFCINTSYRKVLNLINFCFFACIIIGVLQIIINPGSRPSLLFVEPSSAGYFIGPFVFLLFLTESKSKSMIKLTIITIIVRSKSLILSIFSTLAIMRLSLLKAVIIILFVYFFGEVIHEYLFISSDQYRGFSHLVNILYIYGLKGFSSEYDIYSTYLTRLSSIFISFDVMKEYPLGIGFGSFHELYIQRVSGYFSLASLGKEVNETIRHGLITPKSNLLEHSLSYGVVGMCVFLYWFLKLFFGGKVYIKMALLCFIIASAFTELNNFYLYMLLLTYVSVSERKFEVINQKIS